MSDRLHDKAGRLVLPHWLYGRGQALGDMLQAYERVSLGSGEVLLVPGFSGVGKTSLVQEMRSPVQQKNGFFCQGKFNQFQHNVPYAAIRQALQDLWVQVQEEEDEQHLDILRGRILAGAGDQAQLLVDMVPDLERLLGPQQPVPEISPLEARYRFAGVFSAFLQVFCQPEHPLVLFIDDWQWADIATLELFKMLGLGDSLRYLLLIASFRDNEVDEKHPFSQTLYELGRQGVRLERRQIGNLSRGEVRRFVLDCLPPKLEEAEGLVEVVYQRTEGNPFFLRSFMEYIHDFGSLQYSADRDAWTWQGDPQDRELFPGNVVELFSRRFAQRPQEVRETLALAACLGNRFSTELLALVCQQPVEKCLALLGQDMAKGHLLPQNGTGSSPHERHGQQKTQPPKTQQPKTLQFLHDRVQQAAYSLIPDQELPEVKLRIGRLLLASLDKEQLEERLFEVAAHLHAGASLVHELQERVSLVAIGLAAGKKAKAATAFHAALQFCRGAGELLQAPQTAQHLWEEQHGLAMELHLEWAELEYLEGDRSRAEKLVMKAVSQAATPIEQAEAQRVLIVQYTLQARYPEAIAAGRQGLAALGITLPEEEYEVARDREMTRVRENLQGRSIAGLFDMPEMSDPVMRKATQLCITLGPPCYRSHQRLWSVLVPTVVNLTIRHGNMPEVGYSHTAFAGLLVWVENDFDTARQFTELAIRLMTETFEAPASRSVFYLMVGSSARHWFHHMGRSSHDYADAYEIGQRFGNLQYAAYAFGHNAYCRFFQGTPLPDLLEELRFSLAFSRTRHNQWAIDLLQGAIRLFEELSEPAHRVLGLDAWEQDYLQRVDMHQNIQVACIYKVLRSQQLLVMHDCRQALECSDQAEAIIHTVGTQGLQPWPEHCFTRLLILTALHETAAGEQEAMEDEIAALLQRLQLWNSHCPRNYGHKLLLAEAETARLEQRHQEAMERYEQAIHATRQDGFLHWEGVACERAARYWEERGFNLVAQSYWQEAYASYERWGAGAKLQAMEERFASRLRRAVAGPEEMAGGAAANVVERQLQVLRSVVAQRQESDKRQDAETQAEELAAATAKLRQEVAHRKEIQKQLRENEQALLEANAQARASVEAKSAFLANMSHEIRTPLNGILGMLQLLQGTEVAAEQKEYIEAAMHSTKRLNHLLSDILDLSRVEAGMLSLQAAPFSLSELFQTTEQLFSLSARQKNVSLEFAIQQGAPELLQGDVARLQQILNNLVGNALKFTETGSVHVEAALLPEGEGDTDWMLLTVADSGMGIPDAMLDVLFEPFTQGEGDYSRRYQGAGLGLSIVKRLVQLMGGSVTIDSEAGRGTTFYLSIPFASAPQPAARQAPRIGDDISAPLELAVLLAEDDKVSAMVASRQLEKAGCSVELAPNGLAALEALRKGDFDLVLMDAQMPEMDGLEATRRIRNGECGADRATIPIIAMTAYAMNGDREKFLQAGMDDYLAKPVDQQALLEALLRVVMRTRPLHGQGGQAGS